MKSFYILIISALICSDFYSQVAWQQKVEYTISVRLDDVNHVIRGQESFVYTNNSPNVLDFIYIHLWPNAYSSGETALGKQLYSNGDQALNYGNDSLKGSIDSLNFTVNGVFAKLEFDENNPDIAKLVLPSVLQSGQKITVATPFKVKIPSGEISRLGHLGQSYQITQWYPKPAVYDNNGWNEIPYLNQGEFYSEYGTYDVSISLPQNYVVGATGDLQTDSELQFMNELAQKTASSIASYSDKTLRSNTFPPSSQTFKTIRYIQKDVHDFAWFADKRFLVLKGEVELPESKRKVTSWALFTPKNAILWKNAIEYINDGTYFYSKWNGEYPYNQVTAVDGTISAGGGMEYPNVTVIGNVSSAIELEIVIVHEVGHNWFYGILGSNERVHGWMDEGMNTLNELRYVYTKYPENTYLSNMVLNGAFHFNDLDHYNLADFTYRLIADLGEDQPIETHSADFTSANYGAVMYMKTGLVFTYLKHYLGDELFDQCMHTYFEEWKFRHPQPADMKATFERVSAKNLDWLFVDLIQTTRHIDYKLVKVKSKNGTTEITVANSGQVNGPIEVTGFIDGKLVKNQWIDPSKSKTTITWPLEVDEVQINASGRIPEMNQVNNAWHKSGVFGKVEKTKLEFLIGDNELKANNLFWAPAFGANVYDEFMLGIALHNNAIPFNQFQYTVAPLFAFGSKRITGVADISYKFLPKNYLKMSKFGVAIRSFSNGMLTDRDAFYLSVSPFWVAKIGQRKKASPVAQTITVQSMYRVDIAGPSQQELVGGFVKYDYHHIKTNYELHLGLRSDYIANAVNGDNVTRSSAEFTTKLRYLKNKKSRWAEIRFFGGKIWDYTLLNSGPTSNFAYSISGTSGAQDVFTEDFYFGRNEVSGLWSQQRMDNVGGFRSTSNYGTTLGWLATTNVWIESPIGPKIFGVFVDAGLFQNGLSGKALSVYNAGLGIRVSKIFGVYFPLVMSKELSNSYGNLGYGSKIRFTLHLNLVNKPLNLSQIF